MRQYVLRRAELAVLLAGMGAEGLYGVALPEALGQREIQACIYDLYRKRILTGAKDGGDALRICRPVSSMLQVCIKAAQILRLTPEAGAPACCYLTEGACTALLCPDIPSDTVRLWGCASGQMIRTLCAEALLPPIPAAVPQLSPQGPGPDAGKPLRLDKIDPGTGKCVGSLWFIEAAFGYFLTDGHFTMPYTEKNLTDWIAKEEQEDGA